jgi:GPH family glycoside/pentoside/hexuronide:cation symporter
VDGPAVSRAESGGERLPLSLKLCFGAPAFAGAALGIPIVLHMPQFYSDVVAAPLGYIAIAIAVARGFDALTDPFMGWITDRTQTRWGRRKPYIFVGVPLTAVVFWLLFSPPADLTPVGASVWFVLMFGLYFLFHTVYQIPHNALGAEVALDYHERSSLFGIQTIFIQLGIISASVLPAVLIGSLGAGSERQAFSTMAGVTGVLLVLLYALLLWRVPERPEFVARESNPLVPGVRRALRNRPFRILFFAGLVNAIPAAIPAILMRYFVFYVVRPENAEAWFSIFLVIFFVTGTLFIPVWMAVARRFGKLSSFVAASVIGIAGSVLFFFAGEGDTLFLCGVYFLVGIQQAAGTFLIPAMAADTIDYDELLTGKRREAQFSSFWAIIPKFVSIPGSSIPIAILAWAGYVPNAIQAPEVIFWIKFLYALFPVAFYIVALSILSRYPLSEAAHVEIRAGIAAHGRGESAVDPLTGATVPLASERDVEEATGWFLDYFSAGELRRALARGNGTLLRDVVRMGLLALGIGLAATWFAVARIADLDVEPGPLAVIAVVVSGLALTALLFHILRIRPARKMARAAVAPAVVEAHLREGRAI